MSNAIRMICPNLKCRSILSIPVSARGKTVRCRQCSMRIQVPEPSKPKPGTPKPAAPAGGEAA